MNRLAVMLLALFVAVSPVAGWGDSTNGSIREQISRAIAPQAGSGTREDMPSDLSREMIRSLSAASVLIIAQQGGQDISTGSGSIIDNTRWVMTNRHVVEDATDYVIAILDDPDEEPIRRYRGRVVLYSNDYDFAFIEIDRDMDGGVLPANLRLRGIRLSNVDISRGDRLYVFGYPGIGDGYLVFSDGTVSTIQNGDFQNQRLPIWYRTTADISPGNSGGITVTGGGDVIGLPTFVRWERETTRRMGGILSSKIVMASVASGPIMARDIAGWREPREGGAPTVATEINPNAEPHFGDVALSAGFSPDPYTVEIVSGGPVSASSVNSGCSGFIAAAPDFRVNWTGQAAELRLFFQANSGGDTTLVIRAPNGTMLCNDDWSSDSTDPMVSISNPLPGAYAIWVGSFNSGESIDGTLYITERQLTPGFRSSPAPSRPGGTGAAAAFMPDDNPYFGVVTLRAGFADDPHRVRVVGGGSVNAPSVITNCYGFASASPDVVLNWTGNGEPLRVFFEAERTGDDATLLIRTPTNQWFCADDLTATNLNPEITITNAPTGRYAIWVGNAISSTEMIAGFLSITERNLSPGGGVQQPERVPAPSNPRLDMTGEPHFGRHNLAAGFAADPHQVRIQAGGSVDVATVGSGCVGFASARPDIIVNWSGTGSRLRFYFVADDPSADATMVVHAPGGGWFCDDDGGIGSNPLVNFNNPRAGEYRIWVGNYDAPSQFVGGVLHVTELDLGSSAPSPAPTSTPATANRMDPSANPHFGSTSLRAGFSPDPHKVRVTSGGRVRAADHVSGCYGYVSIRPDFVLNWSGSGPFLRFLFEADRRSDDATLVVHTPDGRWFCNDDATDSTRNPLLQINNPPAGRYSIWVGSYTAGEEIGGELRITELSLSPR